MFRDYGMADAMTNCGLDLRAIINKLDQYLK